MNTVTSLSKRAVYSGTPGIQEISGIPCTVVLAWEPRVIRAVFTAQWITTVLSLVHSLHENALAFPSVYIVFETIHVEVFWVVTPYSVVIGYQCFGAPCYLHLQGEINGAGKMQRNYSTYFVDIGSEEFRLKSVQRSSH
jgi:hypothetical protein